MANNYGRNPNVPVTPLGAPALYCQRCFTAIEKKRKAKTPKYCPPCRHHIQQEYKNSVRTRRS